MIHEPLPFADIALVDDHAHPWLEPALASAEPFARYFGEAEYPQPDTLFYRRALAELASLLDCEPTESAVVLARQRPDYAALLARDAHVETLLIDDGYPREHGLSLADLAAESGARVHRIMRIESLAESLIPVHRSLTAFERAFVGALDAARPGLVGLKSVIAYRTGLDIGPRDDRSAAHALASVPPGRLAAKPLNEFALHVAAAWAAQHNLPLQLHSGFGDRDLDLRFANPLHLRPLLESDGLGRGPLVLLHASYPFVREASYLVTVYPRVYVDISEAAPLLSGPVLVRVLQDLLALAPVTRVLYGSDAWGIPDWLWLAARAVRRALGEALQGVAPSDAEWAARRILRDNAIALYRL